MFVKRHVQMSHCNPNVLMKNPLRRAILVKTAPRKCVSLAGVPRLACPILIALFRAGFPRQRVAL